MDYKNNQSDTKAPVQLTVCRECAGRGKVIYDGDCYEECETCKGDRFLEALHPKTMADRK